MSCKKMLSVWEMKKTRQTKNAEHKQNTKASCLKQGSEMNGFCLGFEVLDGTPPPKLSLSAPPGPVATVRSLLMLQFYPLSRDMKIVFFLLFSIHLYRTII